MTSPSTIVGPFVQGEIPDPLEYQFLDANGAAMDLTDYTAKFVVREKWGAAITYDATITAPLTGRVTYTWTGAEFPTAGHYISSFWVGDGTQRYASVLVTWDVRTPVGAVPSV